MLLVGCALGAAAGAAFAWVWLRVVPHAAHRRFWGAMHPIAQSVFQVNELSALLTLYRRLGSLVCGYVARNLGGLLLAGLPAAALLLILNGRSGAGFIAAFALATLAGFLWPRRS
jgi:hypothetical protein